MRTSSLSPKQVPAISFRYPFVPHQEINACIDEPLSCVVVRSDQEPIVVNLDITPIEPPETVRWVDPLHPQS